MEKSIYSSNNKVYKHLKSLQLKKYRDIHNEYLIEGIKLIHEATLSCIKLKCLFVSLEFKNNNEIKNIIDKLEESDTPIFYLDKSLFNKITEMETSQGIVALIERPKHIIANIFKKDFIKIILLDNVQDPGNLGTIIRTADAFKYDCVFLSKGCVDLYNSKSIRATMGSLFHLPILINTDIKEIILKLKNQGVYIFGTNVYEGEPCYNVDFTKNFAIVIGNESKGLSKVSIESVDSMIRIPMPGKSQSLNASTAASILMYESIRCKE